MPRSPRRPCLYYDVLIRDGPRACTPSRGWPGSCTSRRSQYRRSWGLAAVPGARDGGRGERGRTIGLLYGINRSGAGRERLTPWLLIRFVGVRGASSPGPARTLLAGLPALGSCAFRRRAAHDEATGRPGPRPRPPTVRLPRALAGALALAASVPCRSRSSGSACSRSAVKATAFTFGTMLAIYLLGLAAAAWWGRRRRAPSPATSHVPRAPVRAARYSVGDPVAGGASGRWSSPRLVLEHGGTGVAFRLGRRLGLGHISAPLRAGCRSRSTDRRPPSWASRSPCCSARCRTTRGPAGARSGSPRPPTSRVHGGQPGGRGWCRSAGRHDRHAAAAHGGGRAVRGGGALVILLVTSSSQHRPARARPLRRPARRHRAHRPAVVPAALDYCEKRGDCMFVGAVPEAIGGGGHARSSTAPVSRARRSTARSTARGSRRPTRSRQGRRPGPRGSRPTGHVMGVVRAHRDDARASTRRRPATRPGCSARSTSSTG